MSNGPILTNQKVHLKKTTKLFLLNAELPIYMLHYSFSLLYFSKQYFFFLNIIIKPQFLILLILFIIDSLIKNELIIFNFFRLLLYYDESYISIGNWGCGVYNGIFQLKFLEQWIAASFSGVQRNLYSDDLLAHQISSNAGLHN